MASGGEFEQIQTLHVHHVHAWDVAERTSHFLVLEKEFVETRSFSFISDLSVNDDGSEFALVSLVAHLSLAGSEKVHHFFKSGQN